MKRLMMAVSVLVTFCSSADTFTSKEGGNPYSPIPERHFEEVGGVRYGYIIDNNRAMIFCWEYNHLSGYALAANAVTKRIGAEGSYYAFCVTGDIVIPDTLGGLPVVKIGELAFKDCSKISSIEIPEGVETVADRAFESCASLQTLVFASSVKNIGNQTVYAIGSDLDTIVIKGRTALNARAFHGAGNVRNLVVPAMKVTDYFNANNITNLTFTTNGSLRVTAELFAEFNDVDHYRCDRVETLTLLGEFESVENTAFVGTLPQLKEIRVTKASRPLVREAVAASSRDIRITLIDDSGNLTCDPPVISPNCGTTFGSSLTVLMTCEMADAEIHYTTNGVTPTIDSPIYKKFKIYGKTTVKAVAYLADGTASDMAVAEYAKGLCEEPTVTPADGTVFEHSGQKVSLAHDNPEGVLRYTTDGSDPTIESAEYEGPFTIDETTTIKAKVFGDQYFDSSIVTATLTRVWLKVVTPEIAAEAQFTGSQQRVSLACGTEGAVIRYTTNGQDPNSHSTKYTKPFYVTDTTTVKAYATKPDYTNSDIATLTIVKVWGIGDTMGKPDHAFETSGAKGFERVDDATATLKESMKSGAITDKQKSILSTTVIGPGTLTFKWKASCEEDDEYEWDHGEFRVNGEPKGWINGVTDWVSVSQRIEGDGEHTVTWTYVKDENESVEQDCIWVSDYAWASDYTETQTTQVPVPYDWLKEKSRDIVDEYENYEKVAKQTAYNPRFTVEQCYVAGLDPESTTNEFTATIGPDLSIGWKPDLKTERNYKVWGSTNLVNGGDWEWPTNALHRFFKVTVEMP